MASLLWHSVLLDVHFGKIGPHIVATNMEKKQIQEITKKINKHYMLCMQKQTH
jgi:hypothetical protein